jgi:protein phosphatase
MIGDSAGFSEVGGRPANEDSYALWWAGRTFFAAVADGLGGMGGGDFASRYAVEYMRDRAVDGTMTADRLADLVLEAHAGIRWQQRQHPDRRSMATTLTAMSVRDRKLVAAHCGDTRLYLAGHDAITQLSEDHSEASRFFREGRLTRDEFARYPRKNILESALGIPGRPAIQKIECDLQEDDWLIVASDGAYNELEPDEMLDLGRSTRRARKFASALRRLLGTRRPRDNYTMVVARVAV